MRERDGGVVSKDKLEGASITSELPRLLLADEVAELLSTSRKAVYGMADRGVLPGVVRLGRRLLFREDALLDWLREKGASPEGARR